ncbi:MAG: hypothetical protein HZA46_02420 [Planctomycetales bacterium]|nr:hypothetical protein [Planctomycetales bacterium]
MRYTVTWAPETETELLVLWLSAKPAERQHLTRCVNHIDRALLRNPEQKGAPLRGHPGFRFYVAPRVPPQPYVGVVYEVLGDDRVVRVHQLRTISSQA